MGTDALQFKNVSFQYGNQATPSLDDVSFNVKKGAKTLLLGPSGSGKSTVIGLINGLLTKEDGDFSGEILIQGENQENADLLDRSESVGTILQDTDRQFVGLTVAEDIAFILENEGVSSTPLRKAVNQMAEKFDLVDLLHLGPNVLSGGQKQRVALAGVMVGESPLLVLDEPLASLDPKSGQELLAIIEELHQEGVTIIMVEHRLDEVLRYGIDQAVVLSNGQVVFDGNAEKLLRHSDFNDWQLSRPDYLKLLDQVALNGQTLEQIEDVNRVSGFEEKAVEALFSQRKKEKAPERSVLDASDLSYSYERKRVLDNVSLTLKEGTWTALIGRNGSGKSTLSRLLSGFLPVSQGKIEVCPTPDEPTVDVTDLPLSKRAQYIGYVSQNPNEMLIGLSVFEEVATGLKLRKVPKEEIQETVIAALKQAGLYAFRNWPSQALSFGQKRRLSVLTVAVLKPAVLILDEPTAGQDAVSAAGLLTFLNQKKEEGVSILTVTHDLDLIRHWADNVLALVDGQLKRFAEADEIFENETLIAENAMILPSDKILEKRLNAVLKEA